MFVCQVGKRWDSAGGRQRERVCHHSWSLLFHRAGVLSSFQRCGEHQRQHPGGCALWVERYHSWAEWDSSDKCASSLLYFSMSVWRATLYLFFRSNTVFVCCAEKVCSRWFVCNLFSRFSLVQPDKALWTSKLIPTCTQSRVNKNEYQTMMLIITTIWEERDTKN